MLIVDIGNVTGSTVGGGEVGFVMVCLVTGRRVALGAVTCHDNGIAVAEITVPCGRIIQGMVPVNSTGKSPPCVANPAVGFGQGKRWLDCSTEYDYAESSKYKADGYGKSPGYSSPLLQNGPLIQPF